MTVRTDDGYPWAVRDYVEGYLAEDDVVRDARARGDALGCAPIAPGCGAGLRFLAAAIGARAVVEIGTGAGVSGLWLLGGMAVDGVLTKLMQSGEMEKIYTKWFMTPIPPKNVALNLPPSYLLRDLWKYPTDQMP